VISEGVKPGNMFVRDHYTEAKKYGYQSLVLLIEYLVHERKVLNMGDSEEKLSYYLQDKFQKKMNEYLMEYERMKKHAI
jgi:hypothetical protein